MPGRIVVGTSSWADPGFVEEWYPSGLPARDRLAWYAERFDAVEVNSTFYALPDDRTVERWAEVTPDDFTFDVKLHRALSRHAADLKSLPPELRDRAQVKGRGRVVLDERLEQELLEATRATVEPLAESGKLATFLLQLSPAFEPRKHELDELRPVAEGLAPHPVAVELRHRAWVKQDRLEETLGWYEDVGAAWVAVDAPQGKAPTMMPAIDAVTNPSVAYLRAHGRNVEGYMRGRSVAERFAWEYDDDELKELGQRVEGMAEEVASVRMMFNNNRGSDAPKAAERMRELLGQTAKSA
jgi:uncharacterized protein YecE (DUF72 family)